MSSFDDVLDRILSRGDLGVAFVGFAIGYLVNAKFGTFGLGPEKSGVVAAAAAIGLKNSLESALGAVAKRLRYWRSAREVMRLSSPEWVSHLRASQVIESIDSMNVWEVRLRLHATQVGSDYALWRKGLIQEGALQMSILDFGAMYRQLPVSRVLGVRGTQPVKADR